jgi:hypothetical protein
MTRQAIASLVAGQVWWHPDRRAFAVVYSVRGDVARVVLTSTRGTVHRSITWLGGAPTGYLLRYEPPEEKA